MTGIPFLSVFALAIVVMVAAIAKWKIHPFLSIMGVSLFLAIAAGIPLPEIPAVIGAGFSSTFSSIGIVIILGALIGRILEKTGAALKMADSIVKLVGKKHPEAALMLMGLITAIPIFCDSAFVILNPIRKAVIKRTSKSSVACTLSLALGLYITHCFIVPAPTPIAACNILYSEAELEPNLLLVMILGLICAILPVTASYVFTLFIGRKVKSSKDDGSTQKAMQTYEELAAGYGKLPSALMSFAPILLPILLMSLASAMSMAGIAVDLITFLGNPIIALAAGFLLSVILLAQSGKMSKFYSLTAETFQTVASILFVTAAGSVLGKVISASDLVAFIKANAAALQSLGLFFPFLLASILKTAQGSSTVAITTTAGMMAPLMTTLGFTAPLNAALVVAAIGAGSMTVTHANDSYFWVITNFSEMTTQDGYKTVTLGTLIIGLTSMLSIILVSLFA